MYDIQVHQTFIITNDITFIYSVSAAYWIAEPKRKPIWIHLNILNIPDIEGSTAEDGNCRIHKLSSILKGENNQVARESNLVAEEPI